MSDHEDLIRIRAYEIWQRVGMSGDPMDHWLEAERELADLGPADVREVDGAADSDEPQGSGIAQLGKTKVPRPQKVSSRSVPDDIDE